MSSKKGGLSKRLKNMKFMKRKSKSAKRKTKQNDKKAKIEALQWIQSEAAESNLIIDDRMDEYMMYRTGRKSYGKFNEAVEKMEQASHETIKNHSQSQRQSVSTNTKPAKQSAPSHSKKRSLDEFQTTNTEDIVSGNESKRPKPNDDGFIKPAPLE